MAGRKDSDFSQLFKQIESINKDGVVLDELYNTLDMLDDEINSFIKLLSELNHSITPQYGKRILRATNLTSYQELEDKEIYFVEKIDEAIASSNPITVTLLDGEVSLTPFRVVYIDGKLSVIGEKFCDQTLMDIAFHKIVTLYLKDEKTKTLHSLEQVDAYIHELIKISGETVRLVLKIKNSSDLNLAPQFQFLFKPFITNNIDGDKIWAATVQLGRPLYEWILASAPHLEILDPLSVKKEFLNFCLKKLDADKKSKVA